MSYNSVFYTLSSKDSVPSSKAVSGTISSFGKKVIGDGTLFKSEFQLFDYIYIAELSELRMVVNIISDTELSIDEPFSSDLPSGLVGGTIIDNPGTGYTTSSNVPTTGGSGTGFTVDIFETGGVIDSIIINNKGEGYEVGDIVTITGGDGNATIEISIVVMSDYKQVKRFQATKISVENIGVGVATIDGQDLAAGTSASFEKQPAGSSRAMTDFVSPIIVNGTPSNCNITIIK